MMDISARGVGNYTGHVVFHEFESFRRVGCQEKVVLGLVVLGATARVFCWGHLSFGMALNLIPPFCYLFIF